MRLKERETREKDLFLEYCHLHGICWTSIKSDLCLYEKMKEYLTNFRQEILEGLNEIHMNNN